MEMTLEFPRLTVQDAVARAERLARRYGMDTAPFGRWLAGRRSFPDGSPSAFVSRTLLPLDALSMDVVTRTRAGGKAALLIALSWEVEP
jgi:hypothetical protein